MNYCILIELGRKSIAFSYYTSDIDKFEPYGDELVKPLAVWFSGSSVIVGTDAKNEAQRGTPNAFFDLFELMERQEHFDYANEKHEYNKLILYTIRAGLKEFFIKVMKNTQGTLDDNIAKLPLLLSFGCDVKLNERNVLMNQLRDNGFGNLCEFNEDYQIISSFVNDGNIDSQISLILSSDGIDVYGAIYKGDQIVDNFVCSNAGIDPRVDKLARLIWDRTQAESDWLDLNVEMQELQNAAIKFIQSGEVECNDSVILSNGNVYSFYLTRDDLNLYNQSGGGRFVQDIVNKSVQYADKRSCLVVLKDKAADNRYLCDLLSVEFSKLRVLDKANKVVVMEKIVSWCKKESFSFLRSKKQTEPEDKPLQCTKRDEQAFKMLSLSIETYIRNREERKAIVEANEFLEGMHKRNIHDFDVQVQGLMTKINEIKDFANDNGKPIEQENIPQDADPTPRDLRDFKILQKTVETSEENGNIKNTLSEINLFKKKMHAKSIFAFDQELEKMEDRLKAAAMASKNKDVSINVVRPSSLKQGNWKTDFEDAKARPSVNDSLGTPQNTVKSEADELMKKEKFKEARELYRQANCIDQANDCTALIKWVRLLAQYKQEVGITRQSRNKEKAQLRVKEIQSYISLYHKYGIKVDTLESLKNDYEQTK